MYKFFFPKVPYEPEPNFAKFFDTKNMPEGFDKLLCIQVIYQTWKTVFDHIFKHREESWKYTVQQSIFDELRDVWKCGQTLSWVFDIIFSIKTKTKEKTKKYNRQNLC